MKAPDSRERIAAAFALGNAENQFDIIVPALSQALSDPSNEVRKAAALSLMEIGPQARSALPALKEAYQAERDRDAGLSIAGAIRRIAPEAAQEMDLPYY